MKTGDRYSSNGGYVMEVLRVGDVVDVKVLAIPSIKGMWEVDEVITITSAYAWYGWTYLGNFSKSGNFNDLYNKLNEGR